jgi:hypothetical protein
VGPTSASSRGDARKAGSGPEAETLFTKGNEPEPFVRRAVVDPIVSLLRAGQSVALVGPVGVGKRSLALALEPGERTAQPTGGGRDDLG